MKYYYTAGQYKELLKHLRILATTNEQVNAHITEFFDKKKIPWMERALKTGDYNFRIDACPELGFNVDTYFTDELFIERKNSLSELASSINNEAFHYELKRARNIPHKYLLVEQVSGLQGILTHDYPNKYSEKSFWATLHTFEVEYGLRIKFINKENMGLTIYSICKAVLDSKILK
jgi:ERCC4-type nuclease